MNNFSMNIHLTVSISYDSYKVNVRDILRTFEP